MLTTFSNVIIRFASISQEISIAIKDILDIAVAKVVFEAGPASLQSKQSAHTARESEDAAERRMQEFILQTSLQVEGAIRSNKALEWHLEVKERRARALATALDMSLSAQCIAEERWLSAQQRRGAEWRREQSQAWARVMLLEQRVALLTTQLDAANRRSVELVAATARAQQERDVAAEALEGLQRRYDMSMSDHTTELASAGERYEERFSQRMRELHGELRDFVREEALRVLSRSDPDDQVIVLTMDLCAHKAEHKALLERIGMLGEHVDGLRRLAATQRETLQRSEQRLLEAQRQLAEVRRAVTDGSTPGEPREELESALFSVRSDLQYERAQSDRLRAELAEAVAAIDESERREREGVETLSQLQAASKQELAVQRQALLAEMRRAEEDLQRRHALQLSRQQQLLENAEGELARAQMELSASAEQRRSRPEAGVNTDDELLSMERAEVESRVARMHEELAHLSAQVRSLDGELVAAREESEKKDDVLRSLEAAIAAAAGKEGARPGGGAASLSKQLVAAKVAEAECQRRLRRALQTEADLRQVCATVDVRFSCRKMNSKEHLTIDSEIGDTGQGGRYPSPDTNRR